MNRQAVVDLLRLRPRRGAPPVLALRELPGAVGTVAERLILDLGDGRATRAFLTRPQKAEHRMPAVLYCHAHGARYGIGATELLEGRPSLLSPYGPLLAQRGFVTICLDMPTFGDSAGETEDALAKALLWQGRTLMGDMLSDLLAGFDHLRERKDVDPDRIAAFGLSMGATQAYFLGAIEPRITRVAHLCCFADLAALIATGAHDLHGHYMTVPGLLAQTSFGRIAGLIAPRPHLICVGEQDPLTPPEAVGKAFRECQASYRQLNAEDVLTLISQAEAGHAETPEMRTAVLAFLDEMRDG